MKKMIASFIAGALIFGSVGVYAAGGSMIEVFYNVNDLKINKISKMPKDNKPFIFNGSTYVPLRFVSDELGQAVAWDSKTRTIHIGEQEGGSAVYLGEGLKYLSYQESGGEHLARSVIDNKADLSNGNSSYYDSKVSIKNNIGEEYDKFLYLGLSGMSKDGWNYVEYATNGEYKRFKSSISISEDSKDTSNKAELVIYADDNEIYSKEVLTGFLPEEIDVDITGSTKIKIELRWVDAKAWNSNIKVILGDPSVIK